MVLKKKCPKCGSEKLHYDETIFKSYDGENWDTSGYGKTIRIECAECEFVLFDESFMTVKKFLEEKELFEEYRGWKKEKKVAEAL